MRTSSAASRKLAALLVGAPPTAIASLLAYEDDLLHGIGVFDLASKSTVPSPSSVPWPALWVLLNHSSKHRLCSKHEPSYDWLIADSQTFVNKFKWRLHFQRFPTQSSISRSRSTSVSWCPHEVHPDYMPWAAHFRRVLLKAAHSLGRHHGHSNMYGLLVLGLRLLRTIPYVIVKNDKDHGYTLVPGHEFRAFQLLALPAKMYQPVFSSHCSLRSLLIQCRSLALRLQRFEDSKGLASQLFPDSSRPILSALGCTVKTHKPAGEVGPRTIHRACYPVLAGFSKWLVNQLDPRLRSLQHIAKDSFEFKRLLESDGMHQPSGAVMSTIDLKDFSCLAHHRRWHLTFLAHSMILPCVHSFTRPSSCSLTTSSWQHRRYHIGSSVSEALGLDLCILLRFRIGHFIGWLNVDLSIVLLTMALPSISVIMMTFVSFLILVNLREHLCQPSGRGLRTLNSRLAMCRVRKYACSISLSTLLVASYRLNHPFPKFQCPYAQPRVTLIMCTKPGHVVW